MIAAISAALEAFILEHEYCGELDATRRLLGGNSVTTWLRRQLGGILLRARSSR